MHMITILQLCLAVCTKWWRRARAKNQQGSKQNPIAFKQAAYDFVAGCGLPGTGDGGSPYSAKLTLL